MFEFIGTLEGVMIDWKDRTQKIVVSVEQDAREAFEVMKDKKIKLKICEYKKKRSLDANAYYWTLVTKLSYILGLSNAEVHNHMLSAYGFHEIIGGKSVYVTVPDTEEAEGQVKRSETYHLQPTSQVREGVDGVMYRTYRILRGSSTYNTQEMSRLIDGLISECRDVGIPDCEIATPDERRILKEKYKVIL